MDTPVFGFSSNPLTSAPLNFADKERLARLCASGSIRMIEVPGFRRAAQYVCDRLDITLLDQPPSGLGDGSDVENGYSWRIVDQTARPRTHAKRIFPGAPMWCMVR